MLEHTPQDDAEARLPILREIAEVYRDHIKSDSALVTVLSQIIALDKNDAQAVRELARVYEALGRWRDLLATQTRLAELEDDAGTKAELYRAVARRWLEQFSNVQNAIESYEKVFELLPKDAEATEKLKELYNKRRAYKPLFDLLEKEAAQMEPGAPPAASSDGDGEAGGRAPRPRAPTPRASTRASSRRSRRRRPRSTPSRSRPSATRTGRRWRRCSSGAPRSRPTTPRGSSSSRSSARSTPSGCRITRAR